MINFPGNALCPFTHCVSAFMHCCSPSRIYSSQLDKNSASLGSKPSIGFAGAEETSEGDSGTNLAFSCLSTMGTFAPIAINSEESFEEP